jgi:secreted trypsin-like serine protease
VSWGGIGCGMTAGEYSVYHRVTISHGWTTAVMRGQMPEGTEAFTLSVAPWEWLLD